MTELTQETFNSLSADEIANGLVFGELTTRCPITNKMIEDVKEGKIPIEVLKEEIAKSKLSRVV